MAIEMSEQLSVLLEALFMGAVLGCLYDFFRITRLAFILPALLILMEDLLFFLFSSIILFSYLLRSTNGQIRYYILLGAVAGWVAYYFTAGKLVMAFSQAIIAFVRRLIELVLRPVRWAVGRLTRLCARLRDAVAHFYNKFKNSLKSRVDMLYNNVRTGQKPKERGKDAVAKTKTKAKPKSTLDLLLKLLTIALLILLAVFMVKATLSYAQMSDQLAQVEGQIEEQRLANKDLELALRDKETYMERFAREKLEYALPEERVFIDLSGMEQ